MAFKTVHTLGMKITAEVNIVQSIAYVSWTGQFAFQESHEVSFLPGNMLKTAVLLILGRCSNFFT